MKSNETTLCVDEKSCSYSGNFLLLADLTHATRMGNGIKDRSRLLQIKSTRLVTYLFLL